MKGPIFISLLVILLTLLFSSCKKDEENKASDYREPYLGKYEFTVKKSDHSHSGDHSSSTSISTGTIGKFTGRDGNQHNLDHKLAIHFSEGSMGNSITSCFEGLTFSDREFMHPTLTTSGALLDYPEYLCYSWNYSSHFSGSFSGDTLKMQYGYGDATFSTSYTVSGIRKD